ncbi:hypothetical protein LY78DRAFT_650474 [Colletotrichum sublineola]|nr:hypothetical protein LY78DRAFT_650474 [Colletotrichum sublineola]
MNSLCVSQAAAEDTSHAHMSPYVSWGPTSQLLLLMLLSPVDCQTKEDDPREETLVTLTGLAEPEESALRGKRPYDRRPEGGQTHVAGPEFDTVHRAAWGSGYSYS